MLSKKTKVVLLVRFGRQEQNSSIPQMKRTAAAIKACYKNNWDISMVMTEHLCEGKPILSNGLAEAIKVCQNKCGKISCIIIICNPENHVMSEDELSQSKKIASEAGIEIIWLDKVPPVDEKNWMKYLWRFEYVEDVDDSTLPFSTH